MVECVIVLTYWVCFGEDEPGFEVIRGREHSIFSLLPTGSKCSASGVSVNHVHHFQPNWSLFNGTWQKRSRELDNQLSFEIGEMTLQMQ